jgi:hypothetical protein
MRHAQVLLDALATVHSAATTAASAAGKYRYSDRGTDWPSRIRDVDSLVIAFEHFHFLAIRDLAAVAKALADDTRTRYAAHNTPDNKPWPDSVIDAAGEADRALSKLRAHMEKTPAGEARNALNLLLESVRTARRTDR